MRLLKWLIGIGLINHLMLGSIYAAGPLVHEYVADQAQQRLGHINPSMEALLKANRTAFLFGSVYPDTVYFVRLVMVKIRTGKDLLKLLLLIYIKNIRHPLCNEINWSHFY